jgi:hypothetical protein
MLSLGKGENQEDVFCDMLIVATGTLFGMTQPKDPHGTETMNGLERDRCVNTNGVTTMLVFFDRGTFGYSHYGLRG